MYDEPVYSRERPKSELRAQNLREKRIQRYAGKITEGSKKRLTKAITLLVQSAKHQWIENPITKQMHYHKLSFITLTVSTTEQNLSAKEAYDKLFKHFLQWLRRTKKVTTYVWKAELQKRGQIHYHITLPDWIHWQEIRDKWNNLQRSAGITDAFYNDHGHYDPNSTDIHAVRGIDKLASYLVKYMTKGESDESHTEGKVWDCSDNLKKGRYFTVEMTNERREVIKAELNAQRAKQRVGDRFAIVIFHAKEAKDILTESEKKLYTEHMRCIREGLPEPERIPLPIPEHLKPPDLFKIPSVPRKQGRTDYSITVQELPYTDRITV